MEQTESTYFQLSKLNASRTKQQAKSFAFFCTKGIKPLSLICIYANYGVIKSTVDGLKQKKDMNLHMFS